MDDFWEFLDYARDDAYLQIPRFILRDNNNPLERYTNTELVQRVRFCRQTISEVILPIVYPPIENGNNRGVPVPPILKLYVALRFFATGSYQRVCGDIVSVSQSSICRIINEVSEQLARNLGRHIKFPHVEDFHAIKQSFFEIGGFPGVIGCVDGTHIEVKSPGGINAEIYRNRKGWMSLNVQAVAGPCCEILDIVIRWPGSAHDSRIFNSSSVRMRLERGDLPGIVLGDSAYAQTRHVVYTPLLNPATRAEHRYNSAHIRTRNVVERTFGIWKSRFRCLVHASQYNLRTTTRIIAATAVLHNIAIKERENLVDEQYLPNNIVENPPAPIQMRGNIIRAAFIQRHFENE